MGRIFKAIAPVSHNDLYYLHLIRDMRKKVIILGAAGRDFHDFNMYFRDKEEYEVVCFTAAQLPDIDGRKYPPELAGELYPEGIPIENEDALPELIKKHDVEEVVFSYSDVAHEYLMHRASLAIACGANFRILGPKGMMLKSTKPVVSICAVRTGSGKSQTTRRVAQYFKDHGKKVAVIRHPMPYGDLVKQAVQRFEKYEDMAKHECTIEEMEEYEPHIEQGSIVFAGVDYEKILREAEKEADIILWDGGNNDLPFYNPDLHIVVADPHRAGHELKYHPGEANMRMADVIIINKVETAEAKNVEIVEKNIAEANPDAKIIKAASPVSLEDDADIEGKRVLVIEDGPTVTHGGMAYGAGFIAVKDKASEVIDPRPHAVGSLKDTFEKFPHLEKVLPAMGYSEKQIKELEEMVHNSKCDAVIIGTPIDLRKLITIDQPAIRVRYDLDDKGQLDEFLEKFVA